MTTALADPFARLKASEREHWASFAPAAIFSTVPAAKLVKFAQVSPGQRVLDVGCGTGVVAITAARRGAKVSGLDLSPDLLHRARDNAVTAGVEIDFLEGDAEALPYPDATFNIVLSQFGHIFAPRPEVAVREMLRVLKLGGRLVFSAWPPEHFGGRQFGLLARYAPPPAPGAEQPASPASWGDPNIIRERLGSTVTSLLFERDIMVVASLSPQHTRIAQEKTIGPLAKLIAALRSDPGKLARLRTEYEEMIGEVFEDNALHLHFIMARAVKTR
jgi:SAM-dependent methyltransferase